MIEIDKEMYVVIGTIVGALVGAISAYISARVISKNQRIITEINKEKDIQLQRDKLCIEIITAESTLYRNKLERLHTIISKITLENSQTMSYIQSSNKIDLKSFREIYLANCTLLHDAKAIADLYYPILSGALSSLDGKSNIFWGYQERLLRTDIKNDSKVWQSNFDEVFRVSKEIAQLSEQLLISMSAESKKISEKVNNKFSHGI